MVQVSAHAVNSKSFSREVQFVFPSISMQNLIAIPTMQHASHDLVNIGDDIEDEKDRLLLAFFDVAEQFMQEVKSSGDYWVDYIDPCSGLPVSVKTDGQKVFSEVECAQTLLAYNVMNAGCCKVIVHPQWGSAVYPASIFTTAPAEVVLLALRKCGQQS
ncbi:methylmalonic aciduria and homocystinuria type D protein [Ochromonadaceae sp. CCMP2298]|nr:methylmalonic aciduria and homocystinuria type D protein [Ochromonadaceae sp. CCMP2298]